MKYENDPQGTRLPIKVDATTNGEFAPIPLGPVQQEGNLLAMQAATAHAKRLALTRRGFLVSACGAATTLLGINAAHAKRGATGGYFEVPAEAALDLQLARSAIAASS